MSRPDDATLAPGDLIRCARPMLSFYPPGHPRRPTHRGPLISRGTTLEYVGPYPGRPGMHVAHTRAGGQVWEVPFKLADLAAADG